MKDLFPAKLSRPSFSYEVSEGQACFDGCEGHFEWHPSGECQCRGDSGPCKACQNAYLACTVCELDAKTVEAVATAALAEFHDKRMDLEGALTIVNDYKAKIQASQSKHASLHRAIARNDGFKPGRRAFEQDIVPGNGDSK